MLKKTIHGIQKISKLLDVELSYSTANHNFELGIPLENALKSFFSEYFPTRYKFTSGYLVDEKESVSNQLDWIIYDSAHFPPLMAKAQHQDMIEWIPFNGSYGSVEVKRTLSKSSLTKAVKQIKRTKLLERDDVSLTQINPFLKIPNRMLNIKEGTDMQKCNFFYSGIYAYASENFESGNDIINHIYSLGIKTEHLPDYIVVHGKYFIKKVKEESNSISITPFINQTNGYGIIESGLNSSGIFYTDLITQFSNTFLEGHYQQNLVQNVIRELKLNKISGKRFPKN